MTTDIRVLNMDYVEQMPRAARFRSKRKQGLPFRQNLDALTIGDICWTPYDDHRASWQFEEVSLYRGWIRWGPLMYPHLPDRVIRQYGYIQHIPSSPRDITAVTTAPEEMDAMFLAYFSRLVVGVDRAVIGGDTSPDYMTWFRRVSHPYLTPGAEKFTITKVSLYNHCFCCFMMCRH